MKTQYRTAESVTPSHPDKVCDQISDAILDACLKEDPKTRAAIETMGGHGLITITGELTTRAQVNLRAIAKEVYDNRTGTHRSFGLDKHQYLSSNG